jgi:putative hydrolase of the HAD superfamily
MQNLSVKNTVFVFDLDDTLYSEREYERSGISFVYSYLQENGIDLIEGLGLEELLSHRKAWIDLLVRSTEVYGSLSAKELLALYRGHMPDIRLYPDAKYLLDSLKEMRVKTALITDGRSVTQRQKIRALNLENYFDDFYISEEVGFEKPHPFSYNSIETKNQGANFIFFADNPKKDFLIPNKLGWSTFCLLDRGGNIHFQDFNADTEYLPQLSIRTFDDLILVNE